MLTTIPLGEVIPIPGDNALSAEMSRDETDVRSIGGLVFYTM